MKPALRRAVVVCAALLSMAVTASMGAWQLRRADEKLRLQQAIEERGRSAPLSDALLANEPVQAMEQHYRPVEANGEWVPEATVYLENRQMGGRPGFFVLTPLRLAEGRVVLVQRGWAPRDLTDRTRVPEMSPMPGSLHIVGRVGPWPSRLFSLGADSRGPVRLNIDRESFGAEHGLSLLPLSIAELEPPSSSRGPMADGLLRNWPQPAVDVGKHYGYAAQWFGFCAIIGGLYAWFQLIRPRLQHAQHRTS